MRTWGLISVLSFCLAGAAVAQTGSGGATPPRPASDTNMVFRSPRALVEPIELIQYRDAWGLDILFSNYGFGAGAFYRHEYTNELFGFAVLEFSGVKNSNEITLYDPYTGTYIAPPGKVNDVYMIPFAIGVQYRLFADVIAESFRPYVNAGAGPTVILAAPYELDFFTGIAHAAVHVAPDFFVGIGANIGRDKRTVSGVNFRYYYIPYKKGVESIAGYPITDFGGFFITLNWGMAF